MRKTKTITATFGRDKGKVFVLTEMPADKAERWALRFLFALGNTGVEIPAGASDSSMAALAALGYQALLKTKFEAVEPLVDEMFDCVQYQHKGKQPPQDILPGENSQIEEWQTRLLLRKGVFALHMDFFDSAEAPTTGHKHSAEERTS